VQVIAGGDSDTSTTVELPPVSGSARLVGCSAAISGFLAIVGLVALILWIASQWRGAP
jgi:hypothetical protein